MIRFWGFGQNVSFLVFSSKVPNLTILSWIVWHFVVGTWKPKMACWKDKALYLWKQMKQFLKTIINNCFRAAENTHNCGLTAKNNNCWLFCLQWRNCWPTILIRRVFMISFSVPNQKLMCSEVFTQCWNMCVFFRTEFYSILEW